MNTPSKSSGFSLFEALIAMAILATGLLAVAQFQSALVTTSASNKARAEAISLAQQKLDSIRSYTDMQDLVGSLNPDIVTDASTTFDDVVDDAQVPNTAETFTGVNADFSRDWVINKTATTAEVDVTVSWVDASSGTDASGNPFTESVTLSTEITWSDPALVGEQAENDADPIIPDTTGRSRLGDGQYDPADLPDGTVNDDGTMTYENLSTDEVELIDTVTGDVLLTLEEACNVTDGVNKVCVDFVKINGLIWVDDGSLSGDPDLTTIYVLASDNAVCTHRTAEAIDTGTYRYYPYRCYLGGGWSGNLGVVQTGANNTVGDVCMGDPASATNQVNYAARRVYRGMLSRDQYTGAGIGTNTADLATDDVDSDGVEEFDAIGVSDALEMPNYVNSNINAEYNAGNYSPFGDLYLPGHNYMITNLGSQPETADCVAPMTDAEVKVTLYDDANQSNEVGTVDAFLGTKDEFVCMNQVYSYSATDASGNAISALKMYFDPIDTRIEDGYLDTDNDQVSYTTTLTDASGNTVYTVSSIESADASGNVSVTNVINASSKHVMIINECPYNPTESITERDFVIGSIYYTDGTATVGTGFVVNTSDDVQAGQEGNCEVYPRAAVGSASRGDGTTDSSPNATVFADYVCRIYHTYDAAGPTGTGWAGTISITPPNNYGCSSPTSYTFPSGSELTTNTGTQTGAADTTDPTGLDFNCQYNPPAGADLVVSHTLTSGDSTPLNTAVVTFQTTITNNGVADATNIGLTNAVPAGLTYVPASSSVSITTGTANGSTTTAGSWDSTTGIWSGINLLDGDQATLTWNATITGAVGDQITSTVAGFFADQTDTDATTDDLTESIIVTSLASANLQYVISLTSGNVNPGQNEAVAYDVTVTNLGGTAVGNVSLGLAQPAGFSSWTATPVDASQNYAAGTWTIGTMNDGESNSLTVNATVSNSATGTITHTVVTNGLATLPDPSTVNDILTSAISVTAGKTADLVTTITADNLTPAVGDTVTFTITVANSASSPDTAQDVSVTIADLATSGGATGFTTSYSVSGPNPTEGSYTASTGVWAGNLDLAPGESQTLTLTSVLGSSAAASTTIDTTYATATGSPATTDNNPTGDGDIDVDIVKGSGSTVTITGDIIYSADTAVDVTSVAIYAVDAAASAPGTIGTCGTFVAGDASAGANGNYSCTATIDPADTDGVYLVFGFAETICTYNARISSGNLVTSGSDTLLWIDDATINGVSVYGQDVLAYDEGGAKANCP